MKCTPVLIKAHDPVAFVLLNRDLLSSISYFRRPFIRLHSYANGLNRCQASALYGCMPPMGEAKWRRKVFAHSFERTEFFLNISHIYLETRRSDIDLLDI
ncbi:hypothetical protein CDAR_531171 [Caerostris darwini]|uniref:Uncharacterized protein n=1 Tax=Caerostris darwini TaxID=1538125 RepID=A0AAV4Q4Z2_9ARAC|nr:hypothetical protein CDAR_531171 [Caerostris darwini]